MENRREKCFKATVIIERYDFQVFKDCVSFRSADVRCENMRKRHYALSQRHEGWIVVPERYDDGGFSGGNMQRPGLVRLLADIAAGKVDIILVYKIDRLTRSLADFAKIVDVLDKAEASFVSITQSFNTTTSMGRLTLNMLLSFAQFEREVTGERIRDKIAASKRKGMWMGGPVPLGYEVDNRKLVINEIEADLVRQIYQRYLELNSVVELADELNRQGHRTKIQQRTSGPHKGGCIFRRGTLYHLLSNRIYLGQMSHKGDFFPGEHPPIVGDALWDEVQDKLKVNACGTSRRLKSKQPSLLVGLVFDGEGRSMTPSHATKSGRRYRYYVTRSDQLDDAPAWRVSANDLERLVCVRLSEQLTDQHFLCDLAEGGSAEDIQQMLARADLAAATLRSGSAQERHELVNQMITRIDLCEDAIDLTVSKVGLRNELELETAADLENKEMVLTLPATRVRHGHQIRLVIPSQQPISIGAATRDEKLVALMAEAHQARQLILANPAQSIAATAADHGRCRTRLGKLAALACVAPDIVTAIVEGRQPPTLTARSLLEVDLPLAWNDQRVLLGFV